MIIDSQSQWYQNSKRSSFQRLNFVSFGKSGMLLGNALTLLKENTCLSLFISFASLTIETYTPVFILPFRSAAEFMCMCRSFLFSETLF